MLPKESYRKRVLQECTSCSPSPAKSHADAAAGSPSPSRHQRFSATTPHSKANAVADRSTPVQSVPTPVRLWSMKAQCEAERCTPHGPEMWPLTDSSPSSNECDSPTKKNEVPILESPTSECLDEWQFEILSHLPRDRAIDLVDHLKRMELNCSQASGRAAKLTAEVHTLQNRLKKSDKQQSKPAMESMGSSEGSCAKFGASEPCPHHRWSWRRLCFLMVVAILAGAVAWISIVDGAMLAGLTFTVHFAQSVGHPNSAKAEDVADKRLAAGTVDELGLVTAASATQLQAAQHCDPEKIGQIMSEHQVMKDQLEMLQNDIDDAIHHGRNVVCWPVN